jgi:hypothetical protein
MPPQRHRRDEQQGERGREDDVGDGGGDKALPTVLWRPSLVRMNAYCSLHSGVRGFPNFRRADKRHDLDLLDRGQHQACQDAGQGRGRSDVLEHRVTRQWQAKPAA